MSTRDEQVRQMDGARGITSLIVALGWDRDGLIKVYPSSILGNVTVFYYDGQGHSHMVECEGEGLARWLISQRGKPRLAFLQLLDRKVAQATKDKKVQP